MALRIGAEDERASLLERNEALLAYFPLIFRIARHAAAKYGLPVGLDVNDLVSSGVVALAEAWERYDPSRGTGLEPFAVPRIRGAVIDAIRAADWVPRKARQRASLTGTRVAVLVSLDSGPVHGDSKHSIADRVPDEASPEPGAEVFADETRQELLSKLNGLPDRERMILTRYYFHRVRLREIARDVGVTPSRVSQLHGRALRLMRGMDNVLPSTEHDSPAAS
jgi:RNA polymerase sigma factor FliA